MRLAAACCAAALLLVAAPASAPAASTAGSVSTDPNALRQPPSDNVRPPGHFRTSQDVVAIADKQPKVRRMRARHHGTMAAAFLKGEFQWQVSYYGRGERRKPFGKELAQVTIDDRSGRVIEAWTGFQVPWAMARGYPGAFGRRASALYLWLPLCLLFVAPFVDWRRPLRLLHLDLLVLLSFSVSLAFFSHGQIGVSVPLAYPPLVYLLVRMLVVACRKRGGQPRASMRLLVPASWLLIGLIFLVGFRVALNVTNSNVIDVGYSGVIGADRLTGGKALYGTYPHDNQHGDTYGPVNYYMYVPFEQAWPWSGHWDDLPAAHGAAIAFDLLTMMGLWLLGRRIRGPTLGLALAYAWAAYPFTLFVANSNSNDSLVAMLLVGALLVASSAPARGAMIALAGLTKFAPLALAPLFATHQLPSGRRSARSIVLYGAAFTAVAAVVMAPVLIGGDLRAFYDHTVRFQQERGSPFSIWGLRSELDWLQTVMQVGAVLLALAAAVLPRRRDLVGLAAMGAAVLIALQLGVTHWFYLYIVWFLPLVLVALLARDGEPAAAT